MTKQYGFVVDVSRCTGCKTCVEACTERAIHFGDIAELRKTYGECAQTAPLPDPAKTKPALVIIPSPKAAR